MNICLRRRDFIAAIGGAAAWPLGASAQQPAIPVIGFLGARSAATDAGYVEAFRQGLSENGFIAGRNVQIEFRWANSLVDPLPALAAELVRRRVNLIVCAGRAARPLQPKQQRPRFQSYSAPALIQSKSDWSPVSIAPAAI